MVSGVRVRGDGCCTYGVRWECVSIYNYSFMESFPLDEICCCYKSRTCIFLLFVPAGQQRGTDLAASVYLCLFSVNSPPFVCLLHPL